MAKNSKKAKPNPLWGGHFKQGPDAVMEAINASIDVDKQLYAQDIRGSIAHAEMLAAQGIILKKDAKEILTGLKIIREEIEQGKFKYSPALEDIHMHIEARLKELTGDVAGKLHTARSRNDQVATDFRMWVRDAIDAIDHQLQDFQAALLQQAENNYDTILPGFTHLQTAQPITFGHHLLAYVEMIGRDRGRLEDCLIRLNECPLGAAALAGTSFPIDRKYTAKALGFNAPMANSLDAVSSRDFALEFLSALSICITHLSRLAEEIVLWMSDGFGFISLGEAFTTGSSIMPQKRNPDAAELVRAKTGQVVSALLSLLTVMKGLPLAYSKDMQEDKPPVFGAVDSMVLCIQAMTGMVNDLNANKEAMKNAADNGFSTATDLADWLVRELGIPFRDSHHITGKLVQLAEKKQCTLNQLTLDEMQKVESKISKDIYKVLSVEYSVKSRKSFGGTAPLNVKKAIQAAKRKYL